MRNEPAFASLTIKDGTVELSAQITIRDYFAAKAMQGLLAQSNGSAYSSDLAAGAEYAYAMADAMLKVRDASQ